MVLPWTAGATAAKASKAAKAAKASEPGSSFVNPLVHHYSSKGEAVNVQAKVAKTALANGDQVIVNHYDPSSGNTTMTSLAVEPDASGVGFNSNTFAL